MERTIEGFLAALASPAPAPGGGGAAALTGALGIALGNMVGNLTLGKKKYAAVEEELLALNAEAEKLREELLELIDEDARAFLPLSRAYAIPRDDPERGKIMEEALLRAVRPLWRSWENAPGLWSSFPCTGKRAARLPFPMRAAPPLWPWRP